MDINCKFKDLCRFCDHKFYEICCLHSTQNQKDFKKCINLNLCPNLNLCKDAINGNLNRSIIFRNVIPSFKDIESFNYKVKIPFNSFKKRFIPRIAVYGETLKKQIEIVKKLNVDFIAVSLKDMISNKDGEILKEEFKTRLCDKLDFDGKILLQTNIPDCYCIKIMNNSYEYIQALNYLKPDVITTFDANFYLDQPIFASSIQMMNILNANLSISMINIPQVFLLPPAPFPLFKSIFNVFLNSNLRTICIPIGEFKKSNNSHLLNILNYIDFHREKMVKDFELLLISKNPNKHMFADCYSSDTWVKVKRGYGKLKDSQKMERNLFKTIKIANKIKLQKSLISYL